MASPSRQLAVRRFRIDVPNGPPEGTCPGSVLLVTDDADLGRACERVLVQAGYRVTTARHSGHAVLACLTDGPVDVLVTELSMADGSGPSLTERLRAYHAGLQPLYFARAGTMYEADNVLVRPFTGEDLIRRLERLLSQPR